MENSNFDFFCYLMTNNQLKCGIFYIKIMMWAGDDERLIMPHGGKLGQVSFENCL